jgi:hypothetical protein
MCLNPILFDEQIALIGCNAPIDSVHLLRHRQKLAVTSRLLRAYPNPHRPYDPSAARMADKAGHRSRVAGTLSLQTGTR